MYTCIVLHIIMGSTSPRIERSKIAAALLCQAPLLGTRYVQRSWPSSATPLAQHQVKTRGAQRDARL